MPWDFCQRRFLRWGCSGSELEREGRGWTVTPWALRKRSPAAWGQAEVRCGHCWPSDRQPGFQACHPGQSLPAQKAKEVGSQEQGGACGRELWEVAGDASPSTSSH